MNQATRGGAVAANRVARAAVTVLSLAVLGACSGPPPPVSDAYPSAPPARSGASGASAPGVPGLRVEEVATGLEHGWDIGFLPDGKMLVTQRPGRFAVISSTTAGATTTTLQADTSDIFAQGEGGLMGMVINPDFATTREFTTCHSHAEGGRAVDVRLVTWRLSDDERSAVKVRNLLTGLPTAAGGRHSGCRPTIAVDGALIVGTGDTASGSVPQDLTNLGGKTLRMDIKTGKPLPDNPFATAKNANQRYVTSFGHRNIQGVAIQPGTGAIFTAEHGPAVNDEVNRIVPGGNYGWDPSHGGTQPGYDESVPMTDTARFPQAIGAVWESGERTQAVCAATFVSGPQWGSLDGALVITALKGAKLLFLTLDENSEVSAVTVPPELNGPYGRLRAARTGPDGALYVTTTNGDNDRLLRVTPAAP